MEDLLATKLLIPPTRSQLVTRSRLANRLNEGLLRKLTLISAPAGFGKTTLISEWISANGCASAELGSPASERASRQQPENDHPRFAWLSLDENDSDPIRFLFYFIAALRTIQPDLARGVMSQLQVTQPPPVEATLTALINEIAAIPGSVIVVLDDYHMIASSAVDEVLTLLLEHLPPQMHLVVSSRDDPQLPLARLRAGGQLTELRAADLRFTPCETAEFLNQVMGLKLSPQDVAALETRTEGWIAGLQLAAISIQGGENTTDRIQSFTGSHRFVLDYLVEEVFAQQPETIKTFLLQTAILYRLCGPLCDAVTGNGNSQATLESLDHANLFIVPLDDERQWYRYHHLFADLLRNRLHRKYPDRLPELHQRASEWFKNNGFASEAIEHALHAVNFPRAAALIEEHFDITYQRGEHPKLRRWLNELPVELVLTRPYLCILQVWNLFTSGRLDQAERNLQVAEKLLERCPDQTEGKLPRHPDQLTAAERSKLQGRATAIRAFFASFRADTRNAIRYAHRALEQLPAKDLIWRSNAAVALGDAYAIKGDIAAAHQARLEARETSIAAGDNYLTLIANLKVIVTLRMQGELQRVLNLCQQQFQGARANGLSKTMIAGWLLAIWGETLVEVNDLDVGEAKSKQGVELTERGRDVVMIGWSYLCRVRVLFSGGDLAGAEQFVHKLAAIAREYHVPAWITSPMAAWQVRIWLAQNKLDAAIQWVKDHGLDVNDDPAFLRQPEYLALVRTLFAQGRLEEITPLLHRLLAAAEEGNHTTRRIEILTLLALTCQASGDTSRALIMLERALRLSMPGGYLRVYVDEGPSMAGLLYTALSQGIAPDCIRQLLAAFPLKATEQVDQSNTQSRNAELVEPLSEREIEVLQLIAKGLTNQEVGARLFLSLNTVKVHTRNIYGKLGVNNRTGAVARARIFGLLPLT